MNRFLLPLVLLLFQLALFSNCQTNKQAEEQFSNLAGDTLLIEQARGFNIIRHQDFLEIVVKKPWKNADRSFRYYLVDKNNPVVTPDNGQTIGIPVEKVICFSTTHIPHLDYLEETSALMGFPNLDLVSSEKARFLIDQGEVQDIGSTQDINLEVLLNLEPDLVMAFAMGDEVDQLASIEKAGIPVVINADYMEDTPLGRAEWLKFTALFFYKLEMADSIFNSIAENYNSLISKTENIDNKPTVFTGIIYGDTWYMPGGRNYAARFFENAGATYLWEDNQESSFIELGFEAVIDKANQSEFWIGAGDFSSLQQMAEADSRYRNFKAFKQGNIYNYNARTGAKGGNEYFELGYLRPDLVLGDLIHIFHPDLLPNHELYFYRKLN